MDTLIWHEPGPRDRDTAADVVVDCGWGRLVFGQTFRDHDRLLEVLRDEEIGRRDICLYPRDPHVLVARAPHELFVDPSHTYRLMLDRYVSAPPPSGLVVRDLRSDAEAEAMNRIATACGMVPAPVATVRANQQSGVFVHLVAVDADTDEILGSVTGIDHAAAFNDPEAGTSLWSLSVDPQASRPGIGKALTRALAERFQEHGRAYLDLSVMWDNEPAIALYETLGFARVPVFAVKRKNPINEPLFAAPPVEELDALNPYARIVADEALRRGITVQVVDAPGGYLRMQHGGRVVVTRESLSELTSAVAMSRCDDKRVTRRILAEAGLRVPRGREATFDDGDAAFLAEVGEVVVKPARGEQGQGITVGVRTPEKLKHAVDHARSFCPDVLIEEFAPGRDLRVIVIDNEVVAAAVRRPATVTGDGEHTIRDLVRTQSRRREAATGGESRIPLDSQTADTVADAGHDLDDVLPAGTQLTVRRTANLHTGGTIHDVTADLHPALAEAAVTASRALDIPVVGLDFLVPAVDGAVYVFIEANERPGLANHEPQPTASKFIDLLFPGTRAVPQSWDPKARRPAEDHRPGD
jgi:GNAT-family acetyltransferase (TIGR03103 family)